MFNEGQYWEKAQSGQLTIQIGRNKHLALDKAQAANEPYCTHSQEVSYLDQNIEVVRLHQYLRANGSLGGKGRPDPKRMFVNGKLYRIRPLKWYERIYTSIRRVLHAIFHW
jgi:hypothetical protein